MGVGVVVASRGEQTIGMLIRSLREQGRWDMDAVEGGHILHPHGLQLTSFAYILAIAFVVEPFIIIWAEWCLFIIFLAAVF